MGVENLDRPMMRKSNSKDSLVKNVIDSMSFILGRGS